MHFFWSKIGYYLAVWMFHNRRIHNSKINCLHKRMLRIVYKDYKLPLAELLPEDNHLSYITKMFKS